jgi:hypothetical protein
VSDSTTKQCTHCNQIFPATTEYFSPSTLGKYGLRSKCKPCEARVAVEKRHSLGAKSLPKRKKGESRQCSHCERWMPSTDEFFKRRSDRPHCFRSWCKDCINAKDQAYMRDRRQDKAIVQREREYDKKRRSKPEVKARISKQQSEHLKNPVVKQARKQYSHEYEQRPERRLKRRVRSSISRAQRRAAEGFYTKADVELLMRSQKGLCWWCGKPAGDNYEVDHRIAISRGGTNWPNNLCISCFDCNRQKHNKLPHEWNGRLL